MPPATASTQIRLPGQVGFAESTNSPLIAINILPMNQGAGVLMMVVISVTREITCRLLAGDIESMAVLKDSTVAVLYGSEKAPANVFRF